MLKIPPKTEYVIDTLCQNGFEAYIVGGCVRDMLLGYEPHDFDVTTSATPERVMEIFPKTVPTGIKHGTVTVIADRSPIEVTTFRTEGEYTDHRRPESVEFVTSLEADLSRRDFTVNAMAYNHEKGIMDYFGGQNDIKAGILRAVGDPEKRFSEDALRILRLFRFASVLGFHCEETTLKAALKCAKELESISRERIMAELAKAVCGKNTKALLPLTEKCGLDFLGLKHSPDFSRLQKLNYKPELALFTFFYLSGAEVLTSLDILKSSNQIKNYCSTLIKLLSLPHPKTKADIKKMLSISQTDILQDYFEFISVNFNSDTSHSKKTLDEIIKNKEPYLIGHLDINGSILKAMGISGKRTGELLSLLLEAVINDPTLNQQDRLIELIKRA